MSCPAGKIAYPNPQRAWRAIQAMQRRDAKRRHSKRRALPGHMGVYRCETEKTHYHTGHFQEHPDFREGE